MRIVLSIILGLTMFSLLACGEAGGLRGQIDSVLDKTAESAGEVGNQLRSDATPLSVLPVSTSIPQSGARDGDGERDEMREEFIARCNHWALRNMEPAEYEQFDALDPYSMSDLERVLWGGLLAGESRIVGIDQYYERAETPFVSHRAEHLEWCQDYWSEPLEKGNAEKRNHESWWVDCVVGLVRSSRAFEEAAKDAYPGYEDDGMSDVILNQYVRMLNWTKIEGKTLVELDDRPREILNRVWQTGEASDSRYRRGNSVSDWPLKLSSSEDKEWWLIEEAWVRASQTCGAYYPQLFLGRWIPLDGLGLDSRVAKYPVDVRRMLQNGVWPEDVARTDGRDILIELE